ncbi:porin [Grimontia marina]|uniref:Porin-like protein H n=1 Tax=Grimontia marina TaxID=646534 RepID=A0A128ETR9_9GAMM|nr:porin [Grimontia marina]CZF77431.1 Porin-like protein H precursor [Grimontia marina]
MKKTILAMAVPALLAAGAVNAATIYDQDGVTVAVGGAAEVQIIQNYEFTGEDKNLDVRLDDGNLNFSTEVAVSDSLTALGYFDFDWEKGNVSNSDLYAGFKGNFGTFTVGRQTTIWDDTGIGKDIELGMSQFGVVGDASGNNVIKYRYDGDVWFGIAHDLDAWNEETEANEGNEHTDLGVGTSVAGVDLAGYYITGDSSSTTEYDAFQLSAVYNVDAFTAGVAYSDFETEVNGATDKSDSGSLIELLFGYGAGDWQYYLGYNLAESDDDDEYQNVYANATYKLHANVTTYVEAGWEEVEASGGSSDDATGFLVGMEVKF